LRPQTNRNFSNSQMRTSPQSTPKPARRPGKNGKDNLIPISDEHQTRARNCGSCRDAGGWLANILGDIPRDTLGFLFGDKIKIKREENIIKLCAKAKKRLAEQGIEEPALRTRILRQKRSFGGRSSLSFSSALRKVGLNPRIPKRASVDFIRCTMRVRVNSLRSTTPFRVQSRPFLDEGISLSA
jgi:hypothetical protein